MFVGWRPARLYTPQYSNSEVNARNFLTIFMTPTIFVFISYTVYIIEFKKQVTSRMLLEYFVCFLLYLYTVVLTIYPGIDSFYGIVIQLMSVKYTRNRIMSYYQSMLTLDEPWDCTKILEKSFGFVPSENDRTLYASWYSEALKKIKRKGIATIKSTVFSQNISVTTHIVLIQNSNSVIKEKCTARDIIWAIISYV